MSFEKTFLSDLTDSYGRPRQKKVDYYWNENRVVHSAGWAPQVKWPQLEELIGELKGTGIPIAGGAILGCLQAIEFGDIDLFPLNKKDVEVCDRILKTLGYRKEGTAPSSHIYEHEATVYRTVQVITLHTDAKDVYQVLDRFDLSCVQVGVVDGKLHTYLTALKDIQDRYLRVTGTLATRALLDRIIKYKNRGFKFYDEENSTKVELPKAQVVKG